MSKRTFYQIFRAILVGITLLILLALAPGNVRNVRAQDDPLMPPNDALKLPATVESKQLMVERYLALAPIPSYAPGYYDTSVYMLGDVAVGVILPESSGNGENWTKAEQDKVVNEIQAGLDWWKTTGGELANLNFEYDIKLGIPTTYEPITRSLPDQGLWINEVMSGLGYSNGDYWDRVYAYTNDLRNHYQTDWAFTIFVVDSSADFDGKFADGYFAYAYIGGPFLVMTYDNNVWGIENMDKVTAHETGHIFWAGDQYGSCSTSTKYGYLGIANGNCNGNPSIMKDNSWVVDTYARGQIGWKDSDSDNKPDILDTIPVVTLPSYSPNPTPKTLLSYNGLVKSPVYPHAVCDAGDWCYNKDVTVQTIDSVTYQVDNGVWNPAIAQDGAFDADVEDFSFATMSLSPGTHSIKLTASNLSGNVSATWNDSVTVSATAASVGVGVYDDTHLDWAYSGGWINFTTSGPYNNTLHYSGTIGSQATLAFQGNQFVLTYTGYSYRGQMDVYVDDKKVDTINQYDPGLVWQKTWISPILTDGSHTLKLVHAAGGYVDIDAIEIFQVAVSGPGKYDDTHENWHYTASWVPFTVTGAYNDTLTYSTVGAYATFVMDGAQFKLTYTGYPNRGEVEVYVDTNPTPIATISEYDPNLVWQKTWTSPNLGSGVHTLKFVVKSGYIDIDAIEVLQVTPLGPGKYDDTHNNWFYSDNWIAINYPGSGPYANTLHYTDSIGDYAKLDFEGYQVILTYTGYPNRGEVEVYVDTDPNPIETFPEYDLNLVWQKTWTSPNLGAGVHTIKFVVKSGYIDIDAIEIVGTPDTTPPAAINDLKATTGTLLGSVDLSWTAVGDNGTNGTATNYLVRYRLNNPINDEASWNQAAAYTGLIPLPKAPGQIESMTISNLSPGDTYYFAVRAQDEVPNTGAVSTVITNSSAEAFSPPAPPNDNFNDATTIDAATIITTPYTDTNDYFYAATTETGDPEIVQCNSDEGKYSIWYTFTPQSDGLLIVDTYGTNLAYDTMIAVWTVDQSTFTHVACNDDANENTFMSEAVAYLYNGTTYYIEVVQYTKSPQSSPSNPNQAPAAPIDEVVLNAKFNPAAIKGVDKHDEADSDWFYIGNWTGYTGSGPYNNTLHYSTTLNNFVALAFEGNQFVLTYTGYFNRGQMDVYVDNVKVGTLNQYDPGLVWQKTWASPILTNGVHTLKLVHASGVSVDIDAIQIFQIPPLGTGKYDDTQENWRYTGSWVLAPATGPYNNTVTYSNEIGSYATFLMDGSQFELTYTGYLNRGQMDVYVDNVKVGTLNQYDPNLVWQKTWTSPFLTDGIHIIKLVHVNGESIDIDAIEVLQVTPVGLGKYDDTHANWRYTGIWVPSTGTGPYNDTVTYSNEVGASATFVMDGPQFELTYTGHSSRGEVEVYVDSNPTPIATVSEYDPNLVWQKTWLSPNLGDGVHTVKFVVKSGYIDIDAIEVLQVTPLGSGKYDDAHNNWFYSGSWISVNASGPYANTLHYSGTIGNYAMLDFVGTQIILTYTGYFNRGEVEVYVDTDPNPIATFSEYDADLVWQKTWPSPNLGAGPHTVKFVVKSGYIDIDAIEILP